MVACAVASVCVQVNFDKEIMQLIRETKYMQRFGIVVPESAQMVLLQEEKYKFYYNQMTHLVREYEYVVSCVQATIKPLLRPHLEDMEKKIAPGFSLLTWTSMNIDGYLHRFKQVRVGGGRGGGLMRVWTSQDMRSA